MILNSNTEEVNSTVLPSFQEVSKFNKHSPTCYHLQMRRTHTRAKKETQLIRHKPYGAILSNKH